MCVAKSLKIRENLKVKVIDSITECLTALRIKRHTEAVLVLPMNSRRENSM